jgi:hypothetical protein
MTACPMPHPSFCFLLPPPVRRARPVAPRCLGRPRLLTRISPSPPGMGTGLEKGPRHTVWEPGSARGEERRRHATHRDHSR